MYKKGQGTASRVGVAVLGLLLGFYAGHSWHTWLLNPDATTLVERLLGVGFIGSVLLFLAVTGLGLYVAFVHPRTSDYLIDMDVELRKVVWPPVQPLFDPKAEAWGSTYVVIVCTIVLTFFIWVVDGGLQFATRWLYSVLFG